MAIGHDDPEEEEISADEILAIGHDDPEEEEISADEILVNEMIKLCVFKTVRPRFKRNINSCRHLITKC